MRKAKRVLAAILVASVGLGQTSLLPAFAEQAGGCSCVTPVVPGVPSVGSLTGVEGNVLVSRATGFGDAVSGEPLQIGSRVIVGANSFASVSVGQCSLGAPASSTTDISSQGGQICVRVSQAEAFQNQNTTTQGIENGNNGLDDLLPVVIGGVVLIGGGIGLAIGLSGKKKSSP